MKSKKIIILLYWLNFLVLALEVACGGAGVPRWHEHCPAQPPEPRPGPARRPQARQTGHGVHR